MPEMTEPRALFLHELGDMLYAERLLVKALPQLQKEASDDELAQAFREHLEETKQHVANVEAAFEALGETPPKPRSAPRSRGSRKSTTSSSKRNRRPRRF